MSTAPGSHSIAEDATVLFVDLCDSSGIFRRLGDQAAASFVRDLLDRCRSIIERFSGQVVDQVGDELMARFAAPQRALAAAIDMQTRSRSWPSTAPNEPPPMLRIGMHTGSIHVHEDGIAGDSVHVAKRLVDAAKADQVLLSDATRVAIGTGALFRCVESRTLKGQDEPILIHEAIWDPTDATTELHPHATPSTTTGQLKVRIAGGEHVVPESGSLTVGRADPAQFVLEHPSISRLHAKLACERGELVITDFSTNGTYIALDDSEPAFLHRREIRLRGAGRIGFGREPEDGQPHTIHFETLDDSTTS